MDDVVDHDQLRMELGRLIFVDLGAALQQPPVEEARRADDELMVELGRRARSAPGRAAAMPVSRRSIDRLGAK